MSKEVVSFLSLPGEVRNIIYRHALVAKDNVHILDMPPDQFTTTKGSTKRFRELYQTAKSGCPSNAYFRCSCSGKQRLCHLHRSAPDFFKTIYTGDADHNSDLSPALLRTNREIRREAQSIFYQENTFFFYPIVWQSSCKMSWHLGLNPWILHEARRWDSMSTVIPFLKDRTTDSLANIKNIGFHLEIDRYVERNPVYLDWVCTFREVGRMAGLNLQNLSLKVEARRYAPSYGGWWATTGLDWVHSAAKIGGLQELRIEFDLGRKRKSRNVEWMLGVEGMNAAWLWCWLAPRMLADRKGTIEKAAIYLKSKEATRDEGYRFVLDGVKGGEMVWDLLEAMK